MLPQEPLLLLQEPPKLLLKPLLLLLVFSRPSLGLLVLHLELLLVV